MYLRFHRQTNITKLVRLNISKQGLSLSVGPNGARLNISPQGYRTTLGLPGSGLSVIHRHSWGSGAGSSQQPSTSLLSGFLRLMLALIVIAFSAAALAFAGLVAFAIITYA